MAFNPRTDLPQQSVAFRLPAATTARLQALASDRKLTLHEYLRRVVLRHDRRMQRAQALREERS